MLVFLTALLITGTGTLLGMLTFNIITSFLITPTAVGQNQGMSTWWLGNETYHFVEPATPAPPTFISH